MVRLRAVTMVAAVLSMAAFANGREATREAERLATYVDGLARANVTQIALAQVALEKSQNPKIRDFAQRLINDHARNLLALSDWAGKRGMELSALRELQPKAGVGGSGIPGQEPNPPAWHDFTQVDRSTVRMIAKQQRLDEVSGKEFDEKFLKTLRSEQKELGESVKRGQKEFKVDPAFAGVLAKAEPAIKSHEAEAKALEKTMKR